MKTSLRVIGVALIVYAFIFIRVLTEHFANNLLPKTLEEWLCDLSGIILAAIGVIILRIKFEEDEF